MTNDLVQRRLVVLNGHFQSEVDKESDRTLATFDGHPRYEVMTTGQVFDGDDEYSFITAVNEPRFPITPEIGLARR